MKTDQKSEFWHNVIRAAEAEPRTATSIRGSSGFSHPVVAIGVDERRRRVVMISGESDARSAALAQGDIQAAMPSVKVVMARPLAVNLGQLAKVISEVLGKTKIGMQEINWINENEEEFKKKSEEIGGKIGDQIVNFIASPFSALSLNFIAVLKDAVQQLSFIDVTKNRTAVKDNESKAHTLDLSRLIVLDPAEADRRLGVCSIPLYEINEKDMEILKSKPNVEHAREILLRYDIMQYFFPPADQLTLGLVDGKEISISVLLDQLKHTPNEGHPFGPFEIITRSSKLDNVIEALQDRGLLVEGDIGLELTEDAKTFRAQVRFKPREGLISKLSRIFSLKAELSLKDFFKE